MQRFCHGNHLVTPQVKCDERPGRCTNCERLDLQCPGSGDSSSGLSLQAIRPENFASNPPFTQAGIRRRRVYRSCRSCRTSKSRCSGGGPACTRCLQKQIDCVFDNGSRPEWTKAISLAPESLPSSSMAAVREYDRQSGNTEPHLSGDQNDSVQGRGLSLDLDSSLARTSSFPAAAQRATSLEW
jgi:hypothetical protein